MEHSKVIAITQARIGSSRFPAKVLKEINETSLLEIHLSRIKQSKSIDQVAVATTFEEGVEKIINIAQKMNVHYHQGSTDDVLDRYYQTALKFAPDYIVRITSDCPLIDPLLIDQVIEMTESNQLDYGANVFFEEYPDGQDIEVFSFEALKKAWSEASLRSEREHVTPFIRNNSDIKGGNLFKAQHLKAPKNYNSVRMTVDEPQDFETIKILIEKLGAKATWIEYAEFILNNIHLFHNQKILRNEGYNKSLTNDL